MNLTETYLLLFVMLAIVVTASIFLKGKHGMIAPCIYAAGLITALVAQMGFRLREVTEGPFVFVDSTMWVLCGAVFCYLLYRNGTFQYIFNKIISVKRGSAAQMILLVLFIALPGMLSGTAMLCVVTTGMIAGHYMLDKGVEKGAVVELVAVSSFFGMLLPPLSIPAMMTTVARAGAYPGSFEGYFVPLLVAVFPALIVYCLLSGKRLVGGLEAEEAADKSGNALCLIPLVMVLVLLLCYNFLYSVLPFIGVPPIFVVGCILAVVCKRDSFNPLLAAADGVRYAAIELAMMLAFASATEVFTLVGVNGTIAAQLKLAGTNTALIMFAGLAIALLVTCLLGMPAGIVIGAPILYVGTILGRSVIFYMLVGIVISIGMLVSRRGSLIETVSEELEVEKVPVADVLKSNTAVLLVLVIMIFAMLALRTTFAGWMV